MVTLFFKFWWLLTIIVCIGLYKYIFRFIFGMVLVPEDKIGLVTKKFVLLGANK